MDFLLSLIGLRDGFLVGFFDDGMRVSDLVLNSSDFYRVSAGLWVSRLIEGTPSNLHCTISLICWRETPLIQIR
uniref:Uncharacterized protein n=1 Tax=Fagus sylvatica TaxID=28930 RepID=A0A2N9GUH9_FAGSY